jgi:threonyl-tRNA synthetase
MVVLGDREVESGQLAVRSHEDGDLGAMSEEQFAARLADEVF